MSTQEFRFDPAQILQPAQSSPYNRQAAARFGANLNLTRGQCLGEKTSDGKQYPLNPAATDGTQTFSGVLGYSLATDANGNPYFVYGGTAAGSTFYTPPQNYAPLWTGGVFDPNDLFTVPPTTTVGTAEVDTFTPTGTVTVGDIYNILLPNGSTVSTTAMANPTATTMSNQLRAAWALNPFAVSLGAVTGTSTFIVTASTTGTPLSLTPTFSGVSTLVKIVTTAAVSGFAAQVTTITPAGSVTTGDVYTVSVPDGAGVSITVGATQTAAGAVTLLLAAWKANPVLVALATATGSTTFILTAVQPGVNLGITSGVSGTGTVSQTVSTAAASYLTTEVDTITPTNPTTGDVYTVTINYPNLTTLAASFTIGATQTAAAMVTGMINAWNALPQAVAYATASGSTTFILTSTTPGNQMNLTASVVGTGTVAKVVTTAALGRSITDIQNAGRPAAYILQPTGYFVIP